MQSLGSPEALFLAAGGIAGLTQVSATGSGLLCVQADVTLYGVGRRGLG